LPIPTNKKEKKPMDIKEREMLMALNLE